MERLIATKFHIPQVRKELVARKRLVDLLNNGSDSKLTLVSAPAGYGKTTLVSRWVRNLELTGNKIRNPDEIAWLSLDEGDNDLERFLAYFITAINQAMKGNGNIGGGALQMLQSSQPPPMETILTSLVNDVVGVPNKIIVILDDYHNLDSQSVDDALVFFFKRMPLQMRLVIITRNDPKIPLGRMRAQSQLNEIRARDLRFTREEAGEFLNHVMGLDLSGEEVEALEARTEGWIAGLQLAAISMHGYENTGNFIRSFTGSHRIILDYLIEEVLEQQPRHIQDFLLNTSILNRLTSSLCKAVTGDMRSQETLEYLEHANLFIISLDDEHHWYRYHQLFTDLLRKRLRQMHSADIPDLHLRAEEWFEKNGFADEAIEHALRRKDYIRAADLIDKYVDDIWQYGGRVRLGLWLDELPDEVIAQKPHLFILHAGDLIIGGHIEEAERHLKYAEEVLVPEDNSAPDIVAGGEGRSGDADQRKLRGRIAAMRAHLVSYKGDVQKAIQFGQRALENLPESDSTWRASAYDSIGTAYASIGNVPSAYQARLKALEECKVAGNSYMILFASLRLVVTIRDMGRMQEAIEICQQQLKIANQSGLSKTALVGWLFTLWGEMCAEKNDLDEALRMVNKGVRLTRQGQDVSLLGSSYMCKIRVLFSKGDLDQFRNFIEEVNQFTLQKGLSAWITNQIAAWQARMWLLEDNLSLALQWAKACNLDVDGELDPIHDFDYAVYARLLIAQGQTDRASRLLQRLFEAAEAGGRISKMIELLILQSLAFFTAGDRAAALSTLERAMVLAEPGGFIRIFVDEGPEMSKLLYEAAIAGIAPGSVRRLLDAFTADEVEHSSLSKDQTTQGGLIEPLSEREIEVLQRIAEGLTNKEIANRLYLSQNTVKVHLRNIYGKLGVTNRTQAVARARVLGILSTA
jgi:LuxR family maltose regulon positive regulatory protein